MVSMDAFASAFGFDAKSDDVWTALGKVTAVSGNTLSVLLGGSATPTQCEAYCTASVGDVVFVAISKGRARAVARKGGDTLARELVSSDGSYNVVVTTAGNVRLQDSSDSVIGYLPRMNTAPTNSANQAANLVFATPDGSSGYPDFRKLTADDMEAPVTETSNIITANTTNATISSAQFARWGKLAMLQVTFTNKSAISVPASGNITNVEIGTLASGKRPAISCAPVSEGDGAGIVHYYINSAGSVKVCGCDSRGAAYTIAAGTTFYLYATYILA